MYTSKNSLDPPIVAPSSLPASLFTFSLPHFEHFDIEPDILSLSRSNTITVKIKLFRSCSVDFRICPKPLLFFLLVFVSLNLFGLRSVFECDAFMMSGPGNDGFLDVKRIPERVEMSIPSGRQV